MRLPIPGTLRALSLLLLALPSGAKASLYFEGGTAIGSFKNASGFFGQSVASGTSFVGSFSAYVPVTREQNFMHFDLGLQTRMSTATSTSGTALAMGSAHLGARIEIWRFYAGAGYSPITFVSNKGSGLLGMHTNPGTSSYFMEGGAIWRVIPELQIVAAMALEYGSGSSGLSPSPLMEYGLRFRFPLNPKESGGVSESRFDGFRYPFGFMK